MGRAPGRRQAFTQPVWRDPGARAGGHTTIPTCPQNLIDKGAKTDRGWALARQGCILVQDKTDGQINVVKKSFDQDAPPADLYDSIKIEAPALALNPKP